MNDKLNEERYRMREEKIKKSSDRLLYGFLIFFAAGYLIFFTSTLWLPTTYTGVDAKPLGTVVSENNRDITIDKWDYSKEQKMMEILIEIDDYSIDGLHDYNWTVFTVDGKLNTEVVVSDDELVVLRAYKVPKRWKEAKVVMDISDADKVTGTEFTPVTIYTNDKIVTEVSEIKEQDLQGYKVAAYTNRIEVTKQNIATAEQELAEINSQIAEAESNIKALQEKMEFQTESERADSQERITGFNSQIGSLTNQKEEKEAEIADLKEKIELTEKLLLKTTDPKAYERTEAESQKQEETSATDDNSEETEAEETNDDTNAKSEGGE